MTTIAIRDAIVHVLRFVQDQSGREWVEISDHTRVIGVLDGFDSLSALEATILLESKLDVKLSTDNAFVSDDGKKALRLDQIVLLVERMMSKDVK